MDITKHNIRNLYWDIAAWGVTQGVASTFLSVYALRLGASQQQVGLLAALPALVYVFWFIPAGRLVESKRNIKGAGVGSLFVCRLQYLVIALLPFLPGAAQIPVLLTTITIAAVPICVANVAITSIIGDAIPPEKRPRVVSNRQILLAASSSLASFFGGKLLDVLPMPLNYQVLFLIACAASMLSIVFLNRLAVAEATTTKPFSLQPRLFIQQIGDIVATVGGSPSFTRFTLAAVLLHAGLVFGWPLFTLWWVQGLHATEGWIGVITTAHTLVSILVYPLWARLAERKGNRFVFLAGFAGVSFIPLLTALSPSAEYLIIAESLGGLVVPGMSIGLFNTMLELSPAANRPAYIAFYSAMINIPMFLAPILATSVAAPILGVRLALGMTTGLRLLAWLAIFVLVRQRATSA
jgi:MFS family permease